MRCVISLLTLLPLVSAFAGLEAERVSALCGAKVVRGTNGVEVRVKPDEPWSGALWRSAAAHCDVVSANIYHDIPDTPFADCAAEKPLTGRADGECYQVGLVDVVDRPYSEMVAAMRELAKEMYHLDKGKEEL